MSTVQWLFVDINSYFASVEQELNPKLRGKPIAVVPSLVDTTSCLAASYEAKNFGIKTGTLVRDAKKLCPQIIFVVGNHKIYGQYHHQIVQAVESCHPVHSVLSIDEMACRLGGRDQTLDNAISLANEIRQAIYKVGRELHCSIGLAPNKFLSKVASDFQKPKGLTVFTRENLKEKLLTLKPRDLPGIGPRMEERLLKQGVLTMQDLYQQDLKKMHHIWGGIVGEKFYRWIRCEDFHDDKSDIQKSISRSHVLPPHLRSQEGAFQVAQKLLSKASLQLRKMDAWAQNFYISVRYTNQKKWSNEVSIHECQDDLTLNKILKSVWANLPSGQPFKVSLVLSNLISTHQKTLSFFDNQKGIHLSHAMDHLNLKYGKNLVYLGGLHQVKEAAPQRIAFTNIPDFLIDDDSN